MLGVLAVLLASSLFAPPASASPPTSTLVLPAAPLPSSPAASPAFPTPIHHVFVIFMENRARSTVLAQGPFESYLAQHYAQASHYYAVCHPSAPNYLSATSGNPLQCGTDAYKTYNTPNVVSLLTTAGFPNWTAYMQSMPSACDTSDAGIYVVHHDPFLYYPNVVGNRSLCDQHVVGLSNLNAAIASGTVPAYAWITPDNNNDSSKTSVATADAWLHSFLTPLVNDSFFRSSVFFLAYDESVPSDTSGYNGTNGGNVYFSAISPYARSGYTYTADATHYNLLSTVEWLLGLGSTGHHDGTPGFPAMRSLFNFTSAPPPPPSSYAVSGSVTSTNGTVPMGATVTWSNQTSGSAIALNSSGGFSADLPNGTYLLTAAATGFSPASTNVTVAGAPVGGVVLNLSRTPPPPPPPSVLENVSGHVVNATSGSGLVGAELTVKNQTTSRVTFTGANGTFALRLSNGSYGVVVNATAYASLYTSWAVGHANLTERYTLEGSGAPPPPSNTSSNESGPRFPVVVQVVTEGTNSTLGDRTVTVTNLANGTVTAFATDGAGLLELLLPNGSYALVIRTPGFAPAAIDMLVQGSQLVPLPVPLELAAVPPPSGPSPSGPSGTSLLALTVLGVLLVGSVSALGMTWVWEMVKGRRPATSPPPPTAKWRHRTRRRR